MNTRRFIILAALVFAALVAVWRVGHAAPLNEQRFQLSIESGSLVSVLEQLSRQTGLHIGAEISVAKSRASSRLGPFAGVATAEEALRKLLAGTDLWFAWRDEDTIRLFLISAQQTNWSTGVSTAHEASDSIRELAGVHYDTGSCGDLVVGPFTASQPITAETYWVELIKPHCQVIRKPTADVEPGSIDRATMEGQSEYNFSIPQLPRVRAFQRLSEQTGVRIGYLSTDAQEELAPIGPISGRMSLNDALKLAMRGTLLHGRWVDDDIVSVEPAYTMVTYADMTKCRCNFGLPELRSLRSEHIIVTKPRLPALDEFSPAPVTVFNRGFIDATGASTIPELLNYLAQQAYSPGRGYRGSGAQYFEGRGFGAQYSLVLINGHRAYGSAGDPMTNALDLNVVPLSAVERIEVAVDQPSVLHGTDGIGGTVNIVLKRDLQDRTAQTSLGSAPGGSEKKLFTVLADATFGATKAGVVLDYMTRGDLLGSERKRWRDQNYTSYPGGLDYRTPFGAPPNVRSLVGNLPGTDATSAALNFGPDGLVIRPNATNMESALAHAAIVPEQERSSLYGFTSTRLGRTELNLGVLLGHQTASLQLYPISVPGLIWGEQHPQNPFDVDVIVETLLTGLPPRRREAESTLARVTTDISGPVGDWEYSAFLLAQKDRSQAWLTNEIDLSVLARSLTTEDPAVALNVLSERPGEGPLPAGLFLPRHKNFYLTRAVQTGFNLSGRVASWAGGDITAETGVAHRQEAVRFDENIGQLNEERDVSSVFGRLHVPILSPAGTSSMRSLKLTIGARRDFHSDVRDMTTKQYGLSWQPHSAFKVHAGYSELFRPPSLYELHLPRVHLPVQFFDPQREEVAAITLITGGNRSLHPTEGQSIDLGFSIGRDDDWKFTVNYWDTRMRDRIWLVLAQDLINAQPEDLAGRIVRADRTAQDIADDLPGRLLALDTTRANFGAVKARGVDFAFQRSIDTPTLRIIPRIEVTRTLDFRYRDLPAAASPMLNRAGVASVYGTVPAGRAVASLIFEGRRWRASAFARHHSSYRDYSIVAGAATDHHRIPAQTLLDVKLSIDLSDHLSLSVGANNALNDQPPFAQAGGWEGHDQSQGNLVGREAFLNISGSF